MKTAISLPDDLFERADRLAARWSLSRSELYRRAVEEYLRRHAPEEVTSTLNSVLEETEEASRDAFLAEAARRRLKSSEW